MIVKIETIVDNRVLGEKIIEAETIGKALDYHAPDPSGTGVFRVTILYMEIHRAI